MNRLISYVIVAVIGFIALSSTLFVVDQRQYAIVFACLLYTSPSPRD